MRRDIYPYIDKAHTKGGAHFRKRVGSAYVYLKKFFQQLTKKKNIYNILCGYNKCINFKFKGGLYAKHR